MKDDPVAGDYVEKLQSLLRPVTEELVAGTTLEIRHFFGGAAAYANGRNCISLTLARISHHGQVRHGGYRTTG